MSNITKKALEASLKHQMLHKPLNKITIRDITDDCGISRMTFYYHFQDIYDLVEWACIEDATAALKGKKTCATWQEGLEQIFEAVLENKPFVLNAYRCIGRKERRHRRHRGAEGLHCGFLQVQLCGPDAGLDQAGDARGLPRPGAQYLPDRPGQRGQRHPEFFGGLTLQIAPDAQNLGTGGRLQVAGRGQAW